MLDYNGIDPDQMTEEQQIEYVKEKFYNIENITNPSEKVYLESVKESGFAIFFIKNPTKEMVKISIVFGCPLWNIEYAKKWSQEVQYYIKKFELVDDILC
jgi:hypothetical protein